MPYPVYAKSKPSPGDARRKHGRWSWATGQIPLPDGETLEFEGFDEEGQAQLKKHLGYRVRLCRSELGLTQASLSAGFGRTRSWIRGIEAGAQYPPHDFLIELAGLAGRSVAWFYEGVPFAADSGATREPLTPLEQIRQAMAALKAAERQIEEDSRPF